MFGKALKNKAFIDRKSLKSFYRYKIMNESKSHSDMYYRVSQLIAV
jgi:hypothetical protein